MKLEEKLVALRKEKGLSQLQLAESMNVSRQAVSRWEVGSAVPSTENLKYLGRLYDVPLEYLLHDDVSEPMQQGADNAKEPPPKRGRKWAFILIGILIGIAIATAVLCAVFAKEEPQSPIPTPIPIGDIEGSEVGTIIGEFEFESVW